MRTAKLLLRAAREAALEPGFVLIEVIHNMETAEIEVAHARLAGMSTLAPMDLDVQRELRREWDRRIASKKAMQEEFERRAALIRATS
jgi:hypothetical protein